LFMADYVKFTVPKELKEKQFSVLEKAAKSGKIRVGSNVTTKAIERGSAKLVLIAQDVSPPEIVMHLPLLCREKQVPFTFVSTKKELGEKAGIGVGASAIAIVDEGDAKKELDDLAKKLADLSK